MAAHSSVLAWRIPGTVEPDGLLSLGSHSRTRLKRLRSSSSRSAMLIFISSLSPSLSSHYFHLFLLNVYGSENAQAKKSHFTSFPFRQKVLPLWLATFDSFPLLIQGSCWECSEDKVFVLFFFFLLPPLGQAIPPFAVLVLKFSGFRIPRITGITKSRETFSNWQSPFQKN